MGVIRGADEGQPDLAFRAIRTVGRTVDNGWKVRIKKRRRASGPVVAWRPALQVDRTPNSYDPSLPDHPSWII